MTPVIQFDTACRIARAHQEIEAAHELLKVLHQAKDRREVPNFRDAFGRQRGLTLGIPQGESGHRMYDVSPELAVYVIEAHIAKKQAELVEASTIARMQLDGVAPAPAGGAA